MESEMSGASILVRAMWDPEAGVWVATSGDVPGLVAEAETPNDLMRKLQALIPELLEENEALKGGEFMEVPLYVMSEQLSKVRVRSNA